MKGASREQERDVQAAAAEPRKPIMKLITRLLLSHSIPTLIVTVALALVVTALLRISFVLTTLNDTELTTLQTEGNLHAAAWALDIAMRHGQLACAQAGSAQTVKRSIDEKARRLLAVRNEAQRVTPAMRELVDGYLATANDVSAGNPCEKLLGAAEQRRRAQLDEHLTNIWVDRLSKLHRAVAEKDGQARQMAVFASWAGIPLAIASLIVAMLIARHMARHVTSPLASLAHTAQRVGRGDFRTPVRVEGPAEVLALAEELERMRTQLQQLETLKQGFLASVSHELRTPLSKIREALALLQDGAIGSLEERQQRVVQIARTACEREIRMVTTLLDLSRLRAGSPIQWMEGCSIDTVIQRILQDERAESQARQVELEFVTEGEARMCRLDPALVECAISNLIRNAVAVSRRGQRVRVTRVTEMAKDGAGTSKGLMRILVTDEGPGVPEDIRSTIFEVFVTRSVPRSGKALGVGIGLALAREVARAHEGELELLRSEPSGSTFELRIPINDASTAQAKTARALSAGILDVRSAFP